MATIPTSNPRGQRPARYNPPAPQGINASVGQAKAASAYGYTGIDNGYGTPLSGVNAQGVRVPFVNGKPPEQIAAERGAAAVQPKPVPGILNPKFDDNGHLVGGIDEHTGAQMTMQAGRLVSDNKPNPALVQRIRTGQAAPPAPTAPATAAPVQTSGVPLASAVNPASSAAPASYEPTNPLATATPLPAPATPAAPAAPAPTTLAQAMTPTPPYNPATAAAALAQPAVSAPAPYGQSTTNFPAPGVIHVAPGQALSVANGQTVQGGTQGANAVPIDPRYGGGVAVGQTLPDSVPSYTGGAAGRFIGSDEAARNAQLGGTRGSLDQPGPVITAPVTPSAPVTPPTPIQPISAPQTLPATNFPAPQSSLTNARPGEVDPTRNTAITNPGFGLNTGTTAPAANGLSFKPPAPLGNPLPGGFTKPEDFAGPTTPAGMAVPHTPTSNTLPEGGTGENDLGSGMTPGGVRFPAPTADNLFTGTGYKAQPSQVDAMQKQTEDEIQRQRQQAQNNPNNGPKF